MVAIFLISVVDTVCKIFTRDLHSIQLVWGYFVGINLTLWVYFVFKGEKFSNLRTTEKPLLQILRPAFLVCSISSLFIGLTYLPIAEATAIGFVAPLFITALSVPILKEQVDLHRWAAVVVGLVGVVVINSILYRSWGFSLVQPNCAFRLGHTICHAYPCVLSNWNYGSYGSSMYDYRFR